MTIRRHPGEDLLIDYATGAMGEAHALAIASHLALCRACRARAAALDALGGVLLQDAQGVAMKPGGAAAALTRAKAPSDIRLPPAAAGDPAYPAPLRAYVEAAPDVGRWRPLGLGAKQMLLKTRCGATARLLDIPAGTAIPDHGHNGLELTLVLRGAYRDAQGRFARGDLEVADSSMSHQPVAESDGPCLCLAVTDAPLRFSGLLPRLAQPFIGI